uniref:AB hydrolase-1 domain-containing protein n=1 Tax=Anas platyrhynchos platyrhynchos TaxID=8840 RepID=U3I3R4_ANAPP
MSPKGGAPNPLGCSRGCVPWQGLAGPVSPAAHPPAGAAPRLRLRALPHPPLPRHPHQIHLPQLPHTVPGSRGAEARGQEQSWYEEALGDAHPIIIYLHGNGGTRAASHRVQFMKLMGAADFHIVALDYRGYGDSSGYPTESGFTTDVLALYDWVKARSGNSSIIFWGHSLGTGIATNAARKLQEERGVQVDAIVLESPYNSIREAAAHVPITTIYRQFPGFEYLILDSIALANMFFRNDENVKVLACPLLILHAEDDAVLPVQLGRKLFETARGAYKDKSKVKFITFPKELGLGHDYISSNPELPALVKDFLNMK